MHGWRRDEHHGNANGFEQLFGVSQVIHLKQFKLCMTCQLEGFGSGESLREASPYFMRLYERVMLTSLRLPARP